MSHHITHTRLSRRAAVGCAAAITAAGLLASSSPASAASIWTPVASGTTDTITAVSYRPGHTVYGTSTGKIYSLAHGLRVSFPGQSIVDIAASPSGNNLIAVFDTGKTIRSIDGGASWGTVRQLQTFDYAGCASSPGVPVGLVDLPAAPTAVAFSSETSAYVVSNVPGSVQYTSTTGASWLEVSRKADRTCRLKTSEALTDVAPVVNTSSVYFIGKGFGTTWYSSDDLASTPSKRGDSVNCFTQKPSLAVDTADPSRLIAGDGCDGGLSLQYSENSATSYERPDRAPDVDVQGINDVAFADGTMLWAGKAGNVFTSRDGRTAYSQPVEGPDATRDWRSVSAYSLRDAAIGGTGGALYVTTSADHIPDLVAPAGTINDPGAVYAGVAKQFSANLIDDAGGTGIDPASIRWNATGIPEASGNPATITFPSSGYYSLTVRFKDLAGNEGQASKGIYVTGAPAGGSPTGGTIPGTTPGGSSTGRITGASFTLSGPKQCIQVGTTFTAKMSMRRLAIKNNRIVKLRRVDFYVDGRRVKIDRKAPFRQKLAVKNGAAGSIHELKAVGYVKVKRGKSPKRTQKVKFAVCG